jgi:histidine triad (HIT) family protein
MDDCIFCKIIKGEIPSHKVYEDEYTYAFLDIAPNNHGNTLVIPKDHVENIYSIPSETLCRLILTVQKLAIAVKNGTDADGVNLIMNNEPAAGQEVFHAHFHIVPRLINDGFTTWPHKSYLPGEAEAVLEKIKSAIL